MYTYRTVTKEELFPGLHCEKRIFSEYDDFVSGSSEGTEHLLYKENSPINWRFVPHVITEEDIKASVHFYDLVGVYKISTNMSYKLVLLNLNEPVIKSE